MRLLKIPKNAEGIGDTKFNTFALDPQGRFLHAGRDDGHIVQFEIQQLEKLAKLESPSADDFRQLQPFRSLDVHEGVPVNSVQVWDGFWISADIQGHVYKTEIEGHNKKQLLLKNSSEVNEIQILRSRVALLATMNKILAYDLVENKELTPIPFRSDVRSISIDPTNTYLVAISFNKQVSTYHVEFGNGDLLVKKTLMGNQTLQCINDVARLSWSPVGDKFAVPNSSLDPKAASIGVTTRSNWKSEFNMVGHNCNVVKFNPQTYINEENKVYNIIASSGTDKSIAVWNTTFQRPLFVASDVSDAPINDLIWTKDGLTMFAASNSIIIFTYDQEELGKHVSEKLLQDMISKLKIPDSLAARLPKSEEPEQTSLTETASNPETPQLPNKTITDVYTNGLIVKKDEKREAKSQTQSTAVQTSRPPPSTMIQTVASKDGKKRVAPTLLSTNGKASVSVSQTSSQVPAPSNGHLTMEFDAPSYSVPKDLKRREEFDNEHQKKKRELEATEFIGSIAINPSTSFSKIRISTPKIRSFFILDSPDDETLSLDIRNGSGNEQTPSRITLLKNGSKQVFVDFIPKLIGLATGGESYFWAVSSVDGTIYVYSDTGRRIFAPIVIGSPLSFLESKGKYLLAVSSIGEVYAWDVENRRALFEPTTLYPLLARSNPDLLTRAENLTLCSISSSGIPVVTISNGNGYLYDNDMGSWSLISDSWFAFGSQYWDGRDNKGVGTIITQLEKRTNDEIVRRGRGKFLQKIAKTMLMKEGYENLEKNISLAHLENKILIAKKLGEDTEFKNHLIIYSRRISEMGQEAKLQELFRELYGPAFPDPEWDSKILSFDKHELLKELIFACAKNRAVQKVLDPFAIELGILDKVKSYVS